MIKTELAESIFNNYVNGNLSTFRNDLKKLDKLQLIDFIYFLVVESNKPVEWVLNVIYRGLEQWFLKE